MHQAFIANVLVDNLPLTVTSLAVGGLSSTLYIGTSSGTLLVYELNHAVKSPVNATANNSTSDRLFPLGLEPVQNHTNVSSANLIDTQKNFAKKAVDQLLIAKELNAILSMSESYVLLHDIQTYSFQAQLNETKGCTGMAIWTEAVDTGDNEPPHLLTQLAVSVRRKVLLYTWKDGIYDRMKEYNVSNTPRMIAFISIYTLALSMQKEIIVLHLLTSNVETHHAWSSSTSSLYSTAAGMVKSGKTRLIKYGDGFIVTQDAQCITVSDTGVRKYDFPAVVDDFGFCSPYLVIASATRPLEVRHWASQTLIQTFDLGHCKLVSISGTDVFVASQHNVWVLSSIPMENQTLELVRAKCFDDAVALVESLHWDRGDRLNRRLQIKKLGAYSLFEREHYDQTMSLFQELAVTPEEVLALFSFTDVPQTYLPDLLRYGIEIDVTRDNIEARRALTRFLTERRAQLSRLRNPPKSQINSPYNSTLMIPPGLSLSQSHQQQKQSQQRRSMRRSSTASSIATMGSIPRDLPNKIETDMEPEEIQRQSIVVDTALLRLYLKTSDSLVGSLVRVKNYCDTEITEQLLLDAKKYNELIDFYHGKGMHRRALENLARFGSDSSHPLYGHKALLAYLQKISGTDLWLTLEFATWLIQSYPAMGLEFFKDDASSTHYFPIEQVIAQLRSASLQSLSEYLEFLIYDLDDMSTTVHEQYAETLIRLIMLNRHHDTKGDESTGSDDEEGNDSSSSSGANASEPKSDNRSQQSSDLSCKLTLLLRTSHSYDPTLLLSKIPLEDFDQDRAVLLGRLHRHAEAVEIYASRLKDVDKAEEYCANMKEASALEHETCLTLLVKHALIIDTPLTRIIELITRRARYLNASQIIALLADELQVNTLLPFWEEVYSSLSSKRRHTSVVKNLAKRENMIVQADNGIVKQRMIVLDEMSVCPVCAKRIGNSAFAIYPQAIVVHYGCLLS